MDRTRTLEIRYSIWRLLRYLAVGVGALVLSWYLIEEGHWTVAILGWLALPIAGLSVADAIWRFYSATRGPDMTLSLDGIDVYSARIPWSAIQSITATHDYGASNIEVRFFPGDADHLQFDFSGRLTRWLMTFAEADGLLLSAFALQIEHDELVSLLEAFIAETQRAGCGR